MSNRSSAVVIMEENGVAGLVAAAKIELADSPDDLKCIEDSVVNNFGDLILDFKYVKWDESDEYVKFLRDYLEKKDTEGVEVDFFIHRHNSDFGENVEVVYDSLGVVEVETKLKW